MNKTVDNTEQDQGSLDEIYSAIQELQKAVDGISNKRVLQTDVIPGAIKNRHIGEGVNALRVGTADVDVSAGTTPSVGQVLTATSTTAANWQTPSAIPTIDAWTAPTLLNSWVNFGSTFAIAGYVKDQIGFVHLRGLLKLGTATQGTALFTLPVGYRPLYDLLFPVITSSDIFGEVRVLSSGSVQIYSGNNTYLSLDGITFKGEQ